jgi:hypothetical protein
MYLSSSAKSLSNEHFEYLVNHCPLNCIQEVLKNLVTCFDIVAKADFAAGVLLGYHQRMRTLVKAENGGLVLSDRNCLGRKKEYRYLFLDFVYDLTGNKATPQIFEADLYGVSAGATKDPAPEQSKPFEIPPQIFDRVAFLRRLKERFPAANLLTGFLAKLTAPAVLEVVVKVKLVEGKLWGN